MTTTWNDVVTAEPEFAARVRANFDANRHKTIATLRADGSPRISGIELDFAADGLSFGSMPDARKGADLRRDPRFAVHSATVDPPEGDDAGWVGDAKISGRAVYSGALDGPVDGDRFGVEIREVVRISLNGTATAMVVETWTAAGGLRRIERA